MKFTKLKSVARYSVFVRTPMSSPEGLAWIQHVKCYESHKCDAPARACPPETCACGRFLVAIPYVQAYHPAFVPFPHSCVLPLCAATPFSRSFKDRKEMMKESKEA